MTMAYVLPRKEIAPNSENTTAYYVEGDILSTLQDKSFGSRKGHPFCSYSLTSDQTIHRGKIMVRCTRILVETKERNP